MGLLSRAEGRTDSKTPSLDEMGKGLTERIKRLPQNENTPYTILTLLKAYANFNSGACLSLKDGVYSGYVSLGSGMDKMSIPREKVWTKEKAHLKHFQYKLDSRDDFNYWIFPLEPQGSEPWKAVMILEVSNLTEQSAAFNPNSISQIIADVSGKLCVTADAASDDDLEEIDSAELIPVENSFEEPSSGKPLTKDQEIIKGKIADFQAVHGIFDCVVFEGSKEDHLDFSQKVTEIVNTLGTVIPLSPARPLILIPKTTDCELICHRLSRSLNTAPLLSFESSSAGNALNRLESLIEDGSGKDQVFTFKI